MKGVNFVYRICKLLIAAFTWFSIIYINLRWPCGGRPILRIWVIWTVHCVHPSPYRTVPAKLPLLDLLETLVGYRLNPL